MYQNLKMRVRAFLVFVLMLLQINAHADVLVRVDVQEGVLQPKQFYIRLFEDVVSDTVINFLKYTNGTTTNGGTYENVFFHRSVPDFILQTGGFVFDPLNGGFIYDAVNEEFLGGLNTVVTDNPIVNDFKLLNVQGTVAMAKNSLGASSQWFVNLKDNPFLDTPQGGLFTVFGKIMNDGMSVVNELVSHLPVDKSDIHSAFGNPGLPLVNYSANEVVDETKLIKIINMEELISVTGDLDFGLQVTSTSIQRTVLVENKSASAFNMGVTGASDGLSQPFSVVSGSDSCSGILLSAGASCSFSIDYTPNITGDFADSLSIDFPDFAISYTLSVSGGSSIKIEPNITSDPVEVNYGEVGIVLDPTNILPTQIVVLVFNEGNTDLNITSAELSGPDVSFFNVFDNCKIVSPIAPGDSCVLPVNLFPTAVGVKNAVLTIFSDDPDTPALAVPIRASISEDTDGVPAVIEGSSALSGDGNFDDFPDSFQSNVVSFMGVNNRGLTLTTEPTIEIRELMVTDKSLLNSVPTNVNFDFGIVAFNTTVKGVVPVDAFDIGFILPQDTEVKSVYLYGPTADNTSPHWYKFDGDGATGIKLISSVQFNTQDGEAVTRNIVLLRMVDGSRGDNDMIIDGKVVFFGAFDVKKSDSSDTSGLGNSHLLFIVIMAFSLIVLRRFSK